MAQLDEFLQVDTPENVVFGYELAGIGSRFLAALVDTTIIAVLEAVAYITLALIATAGLVDVSNLLSYLGWLIALVSLVSFFILWGYYIVFELLWNGQTPGKRMARLRVMRGDGLPITLTEVLVRNLVRLVDLLPMFYAVGVVTMFIDGQSRRLGDLAAGTVVVLERADVTLSSLVQTPSTPNVAVPEEMQATVEGLPLDRLGEVDVSMIEGYLRRRSQLVNREQMANRITEHVCARLGVERWWPSGTVFETETWLAAILAGWRARQ